MTGVLGVDPVYDEDEAPPQTDEPAEEDWDVEAVIAYETGISGTFLVGVTAMSDWGVEMGDKV